LHLFAQNCDDYRAVAESEMHVQATQHRIQVPAGAIAGIMADGEVAVGHIADQQQLNEIKNTGVSLIHCVRDLRTVLVSQCRFKRRRVQPVSPADKVWRSLPDPAGFLGYLAYASTEVAIIKQTATAILQRKEPRISYESLAGSDDMASAREQLQQLGGSFADRFVAAVSKVRGMTTSTSSDSRSDFRQVWSDAAQDFFQSSGLARLNRQLGYGD
jgi:hypothetical protein